MAACLVLSGWVLGRPPSQPSSPGGAIAVVAATVAGANGTPLDRDRPPAGLIRAALVGGSAAVAVVLLARGLVRLAAGTHDVPSLIRGVRLVFLAVAAAAAGAGWALGDALPLIVALVIGGIDVVETSFLLLVVAAAGRPSRRCPRGRKGRPARDGGEAHQGRDPGGRRRREPGRGQELAVRWREDDRRRARRRRSRPRA